MIVRNYELRDATSGMVHYCPQSMNLDDGPLVCWGSHCMAWRWWTEVQTRKFVYGNGRQYWEKEGEPQRPMFVPSSWTFYPGDKELPEDYAAWYEPDEEAYENRCGYCGLAGEVKHV